MSQACISLEWLNSLLFSSRKSPRSRAAEPPDEMNTQIIAQVKWILLLQDLMHREESCLFDPPAHSHVSGQFKRPWIYHVNSVRWSSFTQNKSSTVISGLKNAASCTLLSSAIVCHFDQTYELSCGQDRVYYLWEPQRGWLNRNCQNRNIAWAKP